MNKRIATCLLALMVSVCLSLAALAEDVPILKIHSKPGSSVCQSKLAKDGEESLDVELCVLGGNFTHDQYSLYIDGERVLGGMDDEVKKGIETVYSGNGLVLLCTPQNKAPEHVSSQEVEAYRKLMKVSMEDAKKMAVLMETVEIGRLCKATLGAHPLIEIQVVF